VLFVILDCDAHFKSDCTEMAGDRPKQPAYEFCSIKRTF